MGLDCATTTPTAEPEEINLSEYFEIRSLAEFYTKQALNHHKISGTITAKVIPFYFHPVSHCFTSVHTSNSISFLFREKWISASQLFMVYNKFLEIHSSKENI